MEKYGEDYEYAEWSDKSCCTCKEDQRFNCLKICCMARRGCVLYFHMNIITVWLNLKNCGVPIYYQSYITWIPVYHQKDVNHSHSLISHYFHCSQCSGFLMTLKGIPSTYNKDLQVRQGRYDNLSFCDVDQYFFCMFMTFFVVH